MCTVYYMYLYIIHPSSYNLIMDHSCFFSLLTFFSLRHALLSFSHSPNSFTIENTIIFFCLLSDTQLFLCPVLELRLGN